MTGGVTGGGSAVKLKRKPLGCFFPLPLVKVNVQSPPVASKPFPLIIPVPSAVKDFRLRETIVDEVKSNVKPLALQKKEDGAVPLNHQGVAILTEVPVGANVAKPPVSLTMKGLVQLVTSVAFIRPLLNLAPPLIVMSPPIETANALGMIAKKRRVQEVREIRD